MDVIRTRRWGRATSQLVRGVLLERESIHQVRTASSLGVSQPRISQIFDLLAHYGVNVDHIDRLEERHKLIELYVLHHLPDIVSEWAYSWEGSHYEHVLRAINRARDANIHAAVSADLAVTLCNPRAMPRTTVLYVDAPLELDPLHFVPMNVRNEMGLLVRYTSDPSLLQLWPTSRPEIPTVHPVQQIWDLHNLGGQERLAAALHIERDLLK